MDARWLCSVFAAGCLVLAGCSGGSGGLAGEEHFTNAKTNLNNQEYEIALKNLDQAIKASGNGPIGQQSTLVQVALMTAIADGCKRMAEAYGEGAKQPQGRATQAQFSKMRADYYGIARVRLLAAMQTTMGQRNKLSDKSMTLGIAFPAFSGTEPAVMATVKGGAWVPDAERYRAERETIRNAMARVVAAMAGAGDNVPKGQEIFQKPGVQIDPRVYLIEVTNTFYRLAEIFDRKALDDARYQRTSLEVVRDNMAAALKLPGSAADKDLEAKAQKIKDDCEKKLKSML